MRVMHRIGTRERHTSRHATVKRGREQIVRCKTETQSIDMKHYYDWSTESGSRMLGERATTTIRLPCILTWKYIDQGQVEDELKVVMAEGHTNIECRSHSEPVSNEVQYEAALDIAVRVNLRKKAHHHSNLIIPRSAQVVSTFIWEPPQCLQAASSTPSAQAPPSTPKHSQTLPSTAHAASA